MMSRKNIQFTKYVVISVLTIFFLSIIFEVFNINERLITDVYADTSVITVNSAYVNDASNSTMLTAISSDGGTEGTLTKNQYLDASFSTLSVSSVTSATLYYDARGTLSGSWSVYLKDSRDGNTICSADPAPENSSETRNSISCTITTTQLSNGVWFYALNSDTAGPENIYLDYIYLSIESPAAVSISITTDGSVSFGTMDENTTRDTTSSDLNDVETVSVDVGPADLDILSTGFTQGGNSWSFGSTSGSNIVVLEYSKDGTNWNNILANLTQYTFDTNVPQDSTRNIYLRLTTPTSTTSYLQYSTVVTITATAP